MFCHCSFAEVSECIFFVLLFHGVVIFMYFLASFLFVLVAIVLCLDINNIICRYDWYDSN